jgi:putative FmdB family regulatory protein
VPTYQYACTECGHDLEAVQSFSDDALTECPVCHGRLRKVFGNVGIVFKGSGFYRNDSRDKKPAGVGAKTEGKTEGKADAGSDSKPDSKNGSATESTKSNAAAGSGKSSGGKDSGSSKPASTPSSTSSTKGSAA